MSMLRPRSPAAHRTPAITRFRGSSATVGSTPHTCHGPTGGFRGGGSSPEVRKSRLRSLISTGTRFCDSAIMPRCSSQLERLRNVRRPIAFLVASVAAEYIPPSWRRDREG